MIAMGILALALLQGGPNLQMQSLRPLADCWNKTFLPMKAARASPERMETALRGACREERSAFVYESIGFLMSAANPPSYADVDRDVNRHVDAMLNDMISKYTVWYETGQWPN